MAVGFVHRLTVVVGVLGLTIPLACSHASRPVSVMTGPGGFLVTEEKIRASGATTAWEALRRTVPILQFRESRGTPARIQRRGTASLYVFVDQVRLLDLKALASMPASDIAAIEVLSGADATTRYGGLSTSGAIVIHTRTGNP